MTEDVLDRGSSYRRRLARAAAASLALHMIFFGGLSVSRLQLAIERPVDSEANEPPKRKGKADFRLQVPRSASSEKPAHESPLSLAVPVDASRTAESRARSADRTVTDRSETAPEATPPIPASRPEFERTRTDDAVASIEPSVKPERSADVAPMEPRATADLAAASVATESATTPPAAPAAAAVRNRGDGGPIAARWRPREVALLDRLTATAPSASALRARTPDESPSAASSTPIARRSAAAAATASGLRAETLAPVAPQAAPPSQLAAPASREPARRPTQAASKGSRASLPGFDAATPSPTAIAAASSSVATVARSPAASAPTAGGATGGRSPGRASSVNAGEASGTAAAAGTGTGASAAPSSGGRGGPVAPAPATSGGGRSGRQAPRGSAISGMGRATRGSDGGVDADGGSAASGRSGGGGGIAALGDGLAGGRDGLAGEGSGGGAGARSPTRDAGGLAGIEGGHGGTVPADLPGSGSVGAGAGTGTAADGGGPGGSGESLMPATINRGGRRGGGRSVLASRGNARGGGESDGEGLSVTPADIASLTAAGRERGSVATRSQGSRSLERIAAAALPTDGRVRDVAKAFAGRSGGGGEPAGGISDRETLDRARAMVDRGLDFLVRSQLPDGRWRLTEYAGVTPADAPKLESDTAATGLALLCFLGAGHDHFSGPHRDTVRRGLEFLTSVQQDDGDLYLPSDDLSNSCSWLYSHGIASIAMCEAVGMTGDPRLKQSAEKACGFIASSRHPSLGGWRYVPRSDADLSVSGWMLVALRAGTLAGVKTDPAALEGVRMLVDASASETDPTRYAYNARKADQRRTDLSVACMTAVGSLMRLHTGDSADSDRVVAAARLLAGMQPGYGSRNQKIRDSYLWYYASQVLVHTGGSEWHAWYAKLVDTLDGQQERDGPLAGSWDAMGDTPDRWGEYGGRLYVTTLHILALEVPWRHLPTYAKAPSR